MSGGMEELFRWAAQSCWDVLRSAQEWVSPHLTHTHLRTQMDHVSIIGCTHCSCGLLPHRLFSQTQTQIRHDLCMAVTEPGDLDPSKMALDMPQTNFLTPFSAQHKTISSSKTGTELDQTAP